MDEVRRPPRVVMFGTYDASRHPRVAVLRDGLEAAGCSVVECNVPLGDSTADRVALAGAPWKAPKLVARVGRIWTQLRRRAATLPDPDVVVVGYLGHLDVHLARRLWPTAALVLDHLVGLGDTLRDRQANAALARGFDVVDRAALRAADLVVVDTPAHQALLPAESRSKAVVVPVGATDDWFRRPEPRSGPLRAVFFGLYTPLHGAPVIGRAAAVLRGMPIRLTMIGHGQSLEETRAAADGAQVTWRDWLPAAELPGVVADHDVCLGIFGTTAKAGRVVPTKAYQGAAAGCAILTSATAPQRDAFGEAGCYVPAGDAMALAVSLAELAGDREGLEERRRAGWRLADRHFRPAQAVRPLVQAIDRITVTASPVAS
ncbi:MAG TPA: glycosyltransferase [Nitriliruptorales bacterium]